MTLKILRVCAGAVLGIALAEQMGGSGSAASRPRDLAASLVFCRPAMAKLR